MKLVIENIKYHKLIYMIFIILYGHIKVYLVFVASINQVTFFGYIHKQWFESVLIKCLIF